MHIFVYVPNGVNSLLMLFASTGTVEHYVVLDFLFLGIRLIRCGPTIVMNPTCSHSIVL